jgi:RND family efflux transporter MFP subunit
MVRLRRIVQALFRKLTTFVVRLGWWKSIAAGVGILALLFVATKLLLPAAPSNSVAQGPREVTVRSVSGLSNDSAPLSVVGEVTSQSQADVRTEGTGEVKAVYASLGDRVSAGQVIAELSNSRERAAVLQSEGVYDGAVAQLNKVRGGSREEQLAILQTTLQNAKDSYQGGKTATVSTLLSAFATIDDAINHKADEMFVNGDTSSPKFMIQSADSGAVTEVEAGRVRAQGIVDRQSAIATTLSESDDLAMQLSKTEAEVREIKNFFDRVVAALNKAVPSQNIPDSTIAVYKIDANTARASVNALLTSLAASRDALAAKQAAVTVAQKNLEQGITGGSPEDVAAAEATVKQAQGALAGARAALEKTIVRTPISGSINALPIKRGDYVTAFQPAVTIANNGALEITAYVTETEARDIVVGTKVDIEGGNTGIVTRLAPAIDPATKKVEVRVGITDTGSLVNGQAVTIAFKRGAKTPATASASSTIPLLIPISALKVGSDKISVFSVNAESKLVAHEVVIGTLLGDKVLIASGITADLEIVTDARGLKEGDIVSVKK